MERLEFLRRQNVDKGLLEGVEEFCHVYAEQEKETDRLQKPQVLFYGREILEMAIAALLEGENLLLTAHGIGLSNMKERVEALNGSIHIQAENGFRIFITIPKK